MEVVPAPCRKSSRFHRSIVKPTAIMTCPFLCTLRAMDVSSVGTSSEPRLLISRAALLHNVKVLRAAAGGTAKVCAMIKANAYGHDAAMVADALCNFSGPAGQEAPVVDAIGVATIDEAAALPE